MSTLTLEYWIEQNDFCMYAEFGDDEKELKLTGQAKDILAKINTIYGILQECENKPDVLMAAQKALSDCVIAPFVDYIRQCSLVRFIVYEDLVRGAFDLLLFENRPLFLQRPVCYQIDEGEGDDAPHIKLESGLMIADLTADPEEACQAVSKLIPDSEYSKMEDADADTIKDAADDVDAVVISAHGDLDAKNQGGFWLNDTLISPKVMGKLEAWIVYVDSCQQGANMSYLQALQDDSDIQYYLAPIISNDAGDSSTKTMVGFFKGVMAHGNPIQALFDTRKRLFDLYTHEQKLKPVTVLNKAFPFRIYEMVDSA